MARTRTTKRPDAQPNEPQRLDLPDHAAVPAPTPPKPARTTYDADTVAAILDTMSTGISLRRACHPFNLPPSTLLRWVRADEPPGLSEQYARAREQQAHALADGIVDLAMDEASKADPNLLRVRLDAAKWAASKILPRVYGDRIDLNHSGNVGVTVGWVVDLTPPADGPPVLDGTAVKVLDGPDGETDPLQLVVDCGPKGDDHS